MRVIAFSLFLLMLGWGAAAQTVAGTTAPVGAGSIGVNKFDLFAQYNGTASGGNGGLAYRRVTRAMARKALDDAKDAGVKYMRVSMSGQTASVAGRGADSLDLWRTNPEAFWRQVDEMMDDLDAREIRLVPVLAWSSAKFPIMAGEPIGEMLRNSQSKAWKLLARYASEFVMRYRGRPTVLFYELTNELNNYVDLDLVRRCNKKKDRCSEADRFTVEDMVAYTSRFAGLIRSLDSTRLVSSGFSIPRPSAEHLRAAPEWTTARTDWRKDSREQFARNLAEIHAGVDIISIHLYGGQQNWRFGSQDAVDLLVEAKRVADRVGKPLFVGEFGGHSPDTAIDQTHFVKMMKKINELGVQYSAIWVWEFYQNSTYKTTDNRHTKLSLEPGYTDQLIERMREANGANNKLTPRTKGKDISAPRVVLTWPLACAPFDAQVTLYAVASDESGVVQKVEFLLDGKTVETDEKIPYQATVSLAGVKPGKHRLTARAHDAAGNKAEFSSDVMVSNNPAGSAECVASME